MLADTLRAMFRQPAGVLCRAGQSNGMCLLDLLAQFQ